MRLTKIIRGDLRYECRIGHIRFEIMHARSCYPAWSGRVYHGNDPASFVFRNTLYHRTLAVAKQEATLYWLRDRIKALLKVVETRMGRNSEGWILGVRTWDALNLLRANPDRTLIGPMFLDWLTENGFESEVQSFLLEPARRARIIWPKDRWAQLETSK